jgi:putative protease
VVKLSETLTKDDTVSFEGVTTNFYQPVDSMEIDKEKIEIAKPGQSVGLKVKTHVRTGDLVFKIIS